jgi:hypothetical protein
VQERRGRERGGGARRPATELQERGGDVQGAPVRERRGRGRLCESVGDGRAGARAGTTGARGRGATAGDRAPGAAATYRGRADGGLDENVEPSTEARATA